MILRVAVVASVAAGLLAGCTSGVHKPAPGTSTSSAGGSTAVATRWWSDSAALAGSRIDSADPSAAAGQLHPSRQEYCAILSDTLAAGKSIMPGVTATDPALATATAAFVSELRAVAPAEVSAAWRTVGDAVLAIARSRGNASALPHVDAAAVTAAARSVAADAKAHCGLDLSVAHS